jgi:hypothetical protein
VVDGRDPQIGKALNARFGDGEQKINKLQTISLSYRKSRHDKVQRQADLESGRRVECPANRNRRLATQTSPTVIREACGDPGPPRRFVFTFKYVQITIWLATEKLNHRGHRGNLAFTRR